MVELQHTSICTYYKPESRGDVEEAFFDLGLEAPDILPYSDILVDPSEFRECQYVFSEEPPTGSVDIEHSEFELSVMVVDRDEDETEPGTSEEFRIHFHVNFIEAHEDEFDSLIEEVLETIPEVELNVFVSYFRIDAGLDEWKLAGPSADEAQLKTIVLDMGDDLRSAIFQQEDQTYVSIRQSDSPVWNLDNFFREMDQYRNLHKEYAQEFAP